MCDHSMLAEKFLQFVDAPIGACVDAPIGACVDAPIGACVDAPSGACYSFLPVALRILQGSGVCISTRIWCMLLTKEA